MWYSATVAAPATEPLTIDRLKMQARVDTFDDDTLLTALTVAAREFTEAATCVRFGSRSGIVLKCDGWDDVARLPETPVTSIASVSYVDPTGATQTLATSVYELRTNGVEAALVLKYGQTWPAIQAWSQITVTAVVGYVTTPESIVHAMAALAAHWYENRETVSLGNASSVEVPMLFETLICNYRRNA